MQTQRRNTGEKCNPHGERGANRDGEPPDGTARSISEKDGITLRDHARQKGRNRPKLPHVSKMAKTFLPKRRESKNERSPRVCGQNCRSPARLSASGEIVTKGVVGISRSTPPAIRRPTERIERTDRSAALVSQSGSRSANLWLCRRGRLEKLLYRRVPHRSVVDSPKRPVSFGYAELHRRIPARTPASWCTITPTNYKTGDGITRSVERRRDCGK